MRRLPAALAALGIVALGLVGCSASASTAAGCPRPMPSSSAAIDLVHVSGSTDVAPTVDVNAPLNVDQTQWQDLTTGGGTTVTQPNQLVVLDVTLVNGQTGQRTVSTNYDGDLSRPAPLSQWEALFPTLGTALQCATEGSRVVVTLPPDAVDLANAGNIGISPGQSAVLVIDLRKVYLPAADGALQYNDAHGLPTVVRAADGRPGIIIPDGDAPTQQVVQVLKKGDGQTVQSGDSVRVQVTQVNWNTRKVTNTTWDSTAQSVDLSSTSLPPGFSDALVGQTVGSQILLVTPAGGGADSATVTVFDIVGIDVPASPQPTP
ncbi:hypothetical protein ABCS02_24965 [Microbacterium sp. X-17]|uniref:FKBP-type peptidyl-prolyl cis-trans isomerase n=1 Tax=Microbacterium sp. X-17 TaxID=3144404 RepID=UPI0031F4F72F